MSAPLDQFHTAASWMPPSETFTDGGIRILRCGEHGSPVLLVAGLGSRCPARVVQTGEKSARLEITV